MMLHSYKSSLPPEGEYYRNIYRVLNKKDMELRIEKRGKAFKVRYDREDHPRIKYHDWSVRSTGNGNIGVFSIQTGRSLTTIILNDRSIKIERIPILRSGTMDYRKASLMTRVASVTNTYRVWSKKKVELRITKREKVCRVLLDREDYERIKTRHWRTAKSGAGVVVVCARTAIALTKVILDNPAVRIKQIPVDKLGRLDYRKASLMTRIASVTNTYRVWSKKKVELRITKREKIYRVLFDREDYERVKAHHWRTTNTSAGVVVVSGCGWTEIALTRVILDNPAVRIRQIPVDALGRLDYRKASLSAAIATFTNTYRFLNKKDAELRIAKRDQEFRIIFDREDYEHVKAHHWRGKLTSTGSVVIDSGPNDLALARVIFKDRKVRINMIPKDAKGRLDYRK
ncbi:MAG: hypothetical protein PVH87_19075 [Desulfobacteraceae bacterium]|jgi:hypothetical protein